MNGEAGNDEPSDEHIGEAEGGGSATGDLEE